MTSTSVVFDRAAAYYDETRGFPPGEEKHVAALLTEAGHLTASSRVLEVGIGTGRIALPLAPLVRAVYGIDLSYPMLERLIDKRTTEPVRIVEGDATHLPWPSGTFDAVIGVHIFHLIPTWKEALQEAARVLSPGGMLLSGFRSHEEGQEDLVERKLWEAWNAAVGSGRPPNVGIERDQYTSFAEAQGWRPVGEKCVHRYTVVHYPHMFLNRLERRVWSHLWRVPDDDFAKGLAAVHEAVRQQQIDLDQPCELQANFTVMAYLPPEK